MALDHLELVGEGSILLEPVFEGHAITPRLPSAPQLVKREGGACREQMICPLFCASEMSAFLGRGGGE
jgi:hypothetical protein